MIMNFLGRFRKVLVGKRGYHLTRNHKKYKYSPLSEAAGEIRLLTLLPGAFLEKVEIGLHIYQLRPDLPVPSYQALSYAWGNARNRHRVSVRDSSGFNDYAMDLATRIGSNIDVDGTVGSFRLKPGFKIEEEDCWWFEHAGDVPEDFSSRNVMVLSLENLFDRPWFKRLWVWQEIILARNAAAVCGSRNLAWSDFRKFSVFFAQNCAPPLSLRTRQNLNHISSLCYCKTAGRPLTVVELMNIMRACKCSDDRDRLYGMYNLLNQTDANAVKIEPDYSKTVSEVYREFAMANYEKAGDLDVMNFCKIIPKKGKTEGSLPSWVPDVRMICSSLHKVSDRALVSSTTSDRNILEVTGKYCTTIDDKKVLPEFTELLVAVSLRQAIRDIAPKGVLCQQYAPMRKKTLLEAFTRTILTLFADNYSPHFDGVSPFLEAQNVVANCLQKREPSIEDHGAENKVLLRMWTTFSSRSFFTTKEGYIGLAPDTAAPGDVLVVLLGLDSPVLLRATTNGCYNVVGTCYVYGLMSSEALLGPLPGDTRIIKYWNKPLGTWSYAFLDDGTQQSQTDDPRLGPLPGGWHFAPENVCKEKSTYPLFCREDTGEATKFDPRLTPEALKERDPQLDLRVFKLI
ncbi:Heterokaryon incompatibility protein [Rutstroemia sp. NJR-2017a BVV2]|nr:Heterokaryon incompatibility protein [Rutstroemia sp. NJR-2017a BVV2]